jgi:thymidylate synthase (FAD)
MKIVKPKTEILFYTEDLIKQIATVARTCYKSEIKSNEESDIKLVKNLLNRGHETMIEFAHLTARIICDRGVTHELVRHRVVSFAQESTRFCNYGKDKFDNEIQVIEPPGFRDEKGNLKDHCEDSYNAWRRACEEAEDSYLYLIGDGFPPQIARSVLPTCLKTEINICANFREWRHIFKLRYFGLTGKPHPQAKEAIAPVYNFFKEKFPIFIGDLEENNNENS